MSFAAIEIRINAATVARFANATASVGGVPVNGVFDASYVDPYNVGLAHPVLTCDAVDVAGVAENTPVTVNGVSYAIRKAEPDGRGLVQLWLRAAP